MLWNSKMYSWLMLFRMKKKLTIFLNELIAIIQNLLYMISYDIHPVCWLEHNCEVHVKWMLVLLICWYSSSVQFVFRTSRETNKKVSSLSISQKWLQLLLMQTVLLPLHEMWNALFTHCSDYLCFYFCSNQNLSYVTTPDIVNNDKSSPFYQVSKIFHHWWLE